MFGPKNVKGGARLKVFGPKNVKGGARLKVFGPKNVKRRARLKVFGPKNVKRRARLKVFGPKNVKGGARLKVFGPKNAKRRARLKVFGPNLLRSMPKYPQSLALTNLQEAGGELSIKLGENIASEDLLNSCNCGGAKSVFGKYEIVNFCSHGAGSR